MHTIGVDRRDCEFVDLVTHVQHALADLAPLPAQRRAHRVRARTTLRPRNAAVLQNERSARRLDRVHRRLHDRLERLLEVERLGNRLGDLRERLELKDTALRVGVELRVDDRLRDLARDRLEQLDLVDTGPAVGQSAHACGQGDLEAVRRLGVLRRPEPEPPKRRVLFLTGTRADFGKLKPLIEAIICIFTGRGGPLLTPPPQLRPLPKTEPAEPRLS